jgi:methyl-accepting chemotaxis protein
LLSRAVLIVVRGYVSRPLGVLSERFAALAEGQECGPVEQPETLCEEMKELARRHEQLRAKRSEQAEDRT